MRIQNTPKSGKGFGMGLARLLYWPDKGGFAYGKLLGLLIAVSIVGGGVWAGKNFLNREE